MLNRLRPKVSLVDGYNLPMRIDTNKGCGVASCLVDLNPNCKRRPALLTRKYLYWYSHNIRSCQVERTNSLWTYIGLQECMSSEPRWQPRSVQLIIYKNQLTYLFHTGNSPNCCTGSHKTAATCPPSGRSHREIQSFLVLILLDRCRLLQLLQVEMPEFLCIRLRRVL